MYYANFKLCSVCQNSSTAIKLIFSPSPGHVHVLSVERLFVCIVTSLAVLKYFYFICDRCLRYKVQAKKAI
jgi:hypothetical protein